jgi:hypothetical protein
MLFSSSVSITVRPFSWYGLRRFVIPPRLLPPPPALCAAACSPTSTAVMCTFISLAAPCVPFAAAAAAAAAWATLAAGGKGKATLTGIALLPPLGPAAGPAGAPGGDTIGGPIWTIVAIPGFIDAAVAMATSLLTKQLPPCASSLASVRWIDLSLRNGHLVMPAVQPCSRQSSPCSRQQGMKRAPGGYVRLQARSCRNATLVPKGAGNHPISKMPITILIFFAGVIGDIESCSMALNPKPLALNPKPLRVAQSRACAPRASPVSSF